MIWEFSSGLRLKVRVSYLKVDVSMLTAYTARYDPFLKRQEADLRDFLEDETMVLNSQMNYDSVEGLSSELKERLGKHRPSNLVRPLHYKKIASTELNLQGIAKRMEGMTPAGLVALLMHSRRGSRLLPSACGTAEMGMSDSPNYQQSSW